MVKSSPVKYEYKFISVSAGSNPPFLVMDNGWIPLSIQPNVTGYTYTFYRQVPLSIDEIQAWFSLKDEYIVEAT